MTASWSSLKRHRHQRGVHPPGRYPADPLRRQPGRGRRTLGYRVPNELPIHVETLLADPQYRAVAHLHPPAVVAADLAGITVRPIYGAYDIPGAWLARAGVPVYERAVLIRNTRLGKEMVAAMRGPPVVILRGHGITSAAATVQQAVLQAASLDALARMALRVRSAGGTLRDIDERDWDELADLGAGFTVEAAWRHEVARLEPGDDAVGAWSCCSRIRSVSSPPR